MRSLVADRQSQWLRVMTIAMTRKYSLMALIFSVFLVAGGFYFLRTSVAFQGDEEVAQAATDAEVTPTSLDSSRLPLQGGQSRNSTTIVEGGDKSEYRCPYLQEDRCAGDPLIASTEAEARWLKYFGYPSPKRLEELEHMSSQELESLSNAGDLLARVMLGKNLIDAGNPDKGRDLLRSALINGNTYAAYELARAQRSDVPGSSQAEAMAYYRLAYLFGDKKASFELYRTTPRDFLDAGTMNGVDERAMELYRNLLKERSKRNMSVRLWPRP